MGINCVYKCELPVTAAAGRAHLRKSPGLVGCAGALLSGLAVENVNPYTNITRFKGVPDYVLC